MSESILTKRQKQVFTKQIQVNGKKGRIECVIRYDDECGNGHNSFSITGTIFSHSTSTADRYWDTGGCIHEEITKHFPEFKHLIKWHLMSSDSPLHYIANTLYHARDTDCDGLKKGEFKAFKRIVKANITRDNSSVILYETDSIYTNKQNNENLKKSNEKEELKLVEFVGNLTIDYTIEVQNCEWSISEGKEINIEGARNCAIWEDATLEQLQDKEALEARIPQLIADFRADIEALGFIY